MCDCYCHNPGPYRKIMHVDKPCCEAVTEVVRSLIPVEVEGFNLMPNSGPAGTVMAIRYKDGKI